jgi:quercetin dioxygenase-like cupin family protein
MAVAEMLVAKSADTPDEVRPFAGESGHMDVVHLPGLDVGRGTFEPGWRWSENVKPIAGTESCQLSHVGYAVSGRITIRLPDGREETIGPGESYTIPPGHDGWVEGNEPFVGIELMSAEQFAKA